MSLGYFVDIQGTLLSDSDSSPIVGARELIGYFNEKDIPYTLVTNNTMQPSDELIGKLHEKGFEFSNERFIDPLMVLKDVVKDGTIFPYGSKRFEEVLPTLGFKTEEEPDVVLVASDDRFDAKIFADMIEKILNGAKLIGMHATSTYVKNSKRYPGVGAILAMLEYATGIKAEVVGKPSETFYKKAHEKILAQKSHVKLEEITMISDDAIGDLVGAKDIGIKTNLVLSGKCKSSHEIEHIKEKIDKTYKNVDEILRGLNG